MGNRGQQASEEAIPIAGLNGWGILPPTTQGTKRGHVDGMQARCMCTFPPTSAARRNVANSSGSGDEPKQPPGTLVTWGL